jgi:hypothetical protein
MWHDFVGLTCYSQKRASTAITRDDRDSVTAGQWIARKFACRKFTPRAMKLQYD